MAQAVLLLIVPLFLSAEPASWFVAASMHSGEIRELVFTGDDILSELVWPLDSLTTGTLGGSFPLGGSFYLSASLEAGSLLTDQHMTDSDYLNLPASGEKTHFSRHPVDLHQYLEFRGMVLRRFTTVFKGIRTKRKICINPGIEFRLSTAAWTGMDGYIQYGAWNGESWNPWHPDLPKIEMDGKVITWNWTRILLAASLSVDVPVGTRFLLSASLLATPLLKAEGRDVHILTGTVFRDTMYGGFFLEPALRGEYQLASGYRFFAAGTWSLQMNTRGDTNTLEDGGGTDLHKISISVGLKRSAGGK